MADSAVLTAPLPARLRLAGSSRASSASRSRRDSREATELGPTSTTPTENGSIAELASMRTAPSTSTTAHGPESFLQRCWRFVSVHWRRHISRHVSSAEARDHFGRIIGSGGPLADLMLKANERTFLGTLRTSLMFAVMGTVIAQLMRLQHAPNPNPGLGFYTLGAPLSLMCIACAICVALLGAVRFLHHQDAMGRGKALAGGWELYMVGAMGFMINIVSFVLVISVDISKSIESAREQQG